MVFLCCLSEKVLMWLDVFLNSSTKFIILSCFSLSNYIFNGNNVQPGLINHICLSFAVHTFILHRRRRPSSSSTYKPVRVGSGGHTMPSPPLKSFAFFSGGAVGCRMGKYCFYGVVYFDHGDGGMQILTVLCFSPQGTFVQCL